VKRKPQPTGHALLDRDRTIRERAWKTIMGLWQSKRDELNNIYRQMLALRWQVAENAGLPTSRLCLSIL
jgi:oligoendopeptidase F